MIRRVILDVCCFCFMALIVVSLGHMILKAIPGIPDLVDESVDKARW